MQRRTGSRGLGAALFTDIVGSTEIAADMGNSRWAELLTRHHQLVRRELRRFGGRENDTAGDGFFARFERPVDAIRCAVAATDAVRALGIELRAGVSFGELEQVDRKAGGLIVNTAARVMSVAGTGEVLVPASVRDIVSGAGISFADHGTHRLKGLDEEIRLFRVAAIDGNGVPPPLEAEEAAERRREIFPGLSRRRRAAIVAGFAAAGVVAVAIALLAGDDERPPVAAGPRYFVVEVDPVSGDEGQPIRIVWPGRPGETVPTSRSIAAGEAAVWVVAPAANRTILLHVDPQHGELRDPITMGFSLSVSMVTAFDAVWVATGERLVRVNAATDEPREVLRIQLPGEGSGRTDLSADRSHLWLARTDGILMQIDPTGTVTRQRKVIGSADLVTAGDGAVWVADQVKGAVIGVDAVSLEKIGEVTVVGGIDRMIADAGYLWILDTGAGVVTRLSVSSDRIVPAQKSVGEGATDVAVGFGAVWVSHEDGRISRIDPSTLEVTAAFARVDGAATAIAVDASRESLWVDVGPPKDGDG
ncbi:MAG TPA: adenylate/guanylate cyclase domain-containing protein [Actinomycetota bacterium]|nr:adenylate/guanylate cyclase domain-containing protein [Actinomycetota bacterium]